MHYDNDILTVQSDGRAGRGEKYSPSRRNCHCPLRPVRISVRCPIANNGKNILSPCAVSVRCVRCAPVCAYLKRVSKCKKGDGGSVVSIVTTLLTERPRGSIPGRGKIILSCTARFRPSLVPTQPSVESVLGLLPRR
jgi:hypothetical protein